MTLRKGRKYVDQELPRILENAELKLSGAVRTLLAQLKVELDQLAERIAAMDRVIDQTSSEHEGCKRMQAIPGIGPVTATAIVAGSVYTFSHFRFFVGLRKVVGLRFNFRGPDVEAAMWSGQIRFACYPLPG